MSPCVPLFLQIIVGCLSAALDATPTLSADGNSVHRLVINASQGLHVASVLSASPMGMVTSSLLEESAPPMDIKGIPASSGLSGHGNTAVTMSPSVPLFVQVGARKFGFHIDHFCLLVLPCSHVVLDCLRECFSTAVLLLKLSGDVEENPGPTTQEMFNEMIQTQKEILSKISEIQTKQASSEATMLQMQNRLLTIEKKLQRVDETEARLEKLEHSVGGCDAEIETLARQIDELENRSRRNNLIVRGSKEVSKETEEILLKRVNDDVFDKILNNKLISIERIHRLGKKVSGRDRPIMLKVSDFRDKLAILKNCFKLKGTHPNQHL